MFFRFFVKQQILRTKDYFANNDYVLHDYARHVNEHYSVFVRD